ncbi:MAG: hypothetical protein HXK05_01705 [Actinomyces graevenitzii]|uniref:DUF6049 family protein n=1 Tax=Actinomyces graevenitzii TaxID=55565 RepID=A0A9E7AFG8_9ACTO|nr:hypothetical protein [Actinomyces graevenitzii]UQF79685.1 MAG: DUF6049 family protein [Actinomyces graevenitzii]
MKRFKKALRCSAIASAMALLAIFPSASAGASATAVTYGKNVAAASSQAAHYATLKTAQAGGVAKSNAATKTSATVKSTGHRRGTPTGSAADISQSAADGLTVEVDKINPEVISPGSDITVEGTITNTSTETLSGFDMRVSLQSRSQSSVEMLKDWLVFDDSSYSYVAHTEQLNHSLAAGASMRFSLNIRASQLPSAAGNNWGARGMEVTVTSGELVSSDRAIAVWSPNTQVQPTKITAVIPLTASAMQMRELLALQSGAAFTPSQSDGFSPNACITGDKVDLKLATTQMRTRTIEILNAANSQTIVAVDPYLLSALGATAAAVNQKTADATPSATASPTASAPATASANTENSTPSATTSATPSASATPTPTQSSTQNAKAVEAQQVAALNQALAGALKRGGIIALPPMDADLVALSHVSTGASQIREAINQSKAMVGKDQLLSGARADVAISSSLELDQTYLDAVKGQVSTVISPPDALYPAGDLDYIPDSTAFLNNQRVLIPDQTLSESVSGMLTTYEGFLGNLTDFDARQLARGTTAVITRQRPDQVRHVLLLVERDSASNMDVKDLNDRLSAINNSWSTPAPLTELEQLASTKASDGTEIEREPLPVSSTDPYRINEQELATASKTVSTTQNMVSIYNEPAKIAGSTLRLTEVATSSAWRQGKFMVVIDDVGCRNKIIGNMLRTLPSSTINLIDSSAHLPVRVSNDTSQPAKVTIHLRPSRSLLRSKGDTTAVIPANSQTTVMVPVNAVGSGDIDVKVSMKNALGQPVGSSSTVHMRVRANWESWFTWGLGSVFSVLMVAGIVRTVHRGRRVVISEG